MAGILACHGAPPAREELERMAWALDHRGPDELGTYRDGRAGLAHARLAIIDLATGQQPLANEDDTVWIAFNGEIFNYVELAEELGRAGHRFRTRSDTEVIVHAYEEWGTDAFRRMNGQWAVALWDAAARRLVLARDPLGVRPLYLARHAGRLYFASEVKAIFAADPTLPRRLDPTGLAETLTFWTVVPPRSVFTGVRELEPGHVLVVDEQGERDHADFELRFDESFTGSVADAAAAVRAALEQATALRMLRADVPVGSYLSGGLDSSLVAALGLRAKGARFQTFSLRFADAEYDETEFQRLMVAELGSEHHDIVVGRADIARVFPDVVWHAERPLLRTAPAPLFLLSRLVRERGIKVVLTGEGADEIFAGYDLFREGKVRRFWARRPSSTMRPRLLERLYPYLARSPVAQRALARQFFGQGLERAGAPGFAHDLRWRGAAALQRLLAPGFRSPTDVVAELLARLPPDFGRWDPLAQDQWLEVKTLLGGYLLSSQGDRMLMAHSVEGRFPFLDRNVVALAGSLPARYKLAVLDEKHVLKRAAAGLVPPAIIARKKQPYRAPDALSFVAADRPEWIDDAIARVPGDGIFDTAAVAALWAKCRARAGEAQLSNADNMALVGVLSTQILVDRFRRAPDPAPRPIATRIERA